MDGNGGLSKVLVIVATLALAGVASYEIRSHLAGSGGGASAIAPASTAEPASEKAPQAEPPSNEIKDPQQLD
jgi:hypothetical protein